jgi:hypothetical protein
MLDAICGGVPEIFLTQDLGFTLPAENQAPPSEESGTGNGTQKRHKIAVSLHDPAKLRGGHRLEAYRKAVLEIPHILRSFCDVVLLVQSRDDIFLYEKMVSSSDGRLRIVSFSAKDITKVLKTYEDADVVLTSRFHGFVFGCLARKPVIALGSPGAKVHRLIKDHIPELLPSFLPIRGITADKIMRQLEKVVSRPDAYTIDPERLAQCRRMARMTDTIIEAHAEEIR